MNKQQLIIHLRMKAAAIRQRLRDGDLPQREVDELLDALQELIEVIKKLES